MADASKYFGKFFTHLFKGDVDVDTASVVAILCDSTYLQDQDGDEFVADLTGEMTDPSYARVTLTGVTATYDGATNKVKLTSDPIVFPTLAGTFRVMVLAVSTGSDATSILLKATTFDADKVGTGSDVTLTPHANGLTDVAVA